MSRKDEINIEADRMYNNAMSTTGEVVWGVCGFKEGAKWADEHPKNPWKSTEEKPNNHENILCYHWYDGPHYFQGYYNAETNEIEYELPVKDKCDFDLIERWITIPKFEEE